VNLQNKNPKKEFKKEMSYESKPIKFIYFPS